VAAPFKRITRLSEMEKTFDQLKEQERNNRRKLILDAARNLFATQDFRSVTTRQIAKAAGMSIGTIYNYYANLDELFLDVFLKNAEILGRGIDEMAIGDTPPFREMCVRYVAFLNDNMTFYQMMGHFMLGGELSKTSTEKLDRMMRSLMDRIEAGIRAAGINGDTRLKAHALFSALNGLMISYARYPGRSHDDIRKHTLRLAGLIADMFAAGPVD